MRGKTHIFFGVLTGEIIAKAVLHYDLEHSIMLAVSAAVGSLFPDIDHPHSPISKSSFGTKAISCGLSRATKHRGPIHTPFFQLVFSMLLLIVLDLFNIEYSGEIVIGFLLGVFSHLILDSFNPTGIMWAYPIKKKHYSFMKIYTGSFEETVICTVLGVCLSVYSIVNLNTDIPSIISNSINLLGGR